MKQILRGTREEIRKVKKLMEKLPEKGAKPARIRVKPTKELEKFLKVSNYWAWRNSPAYQYL